MESTTRQKRFLLHLGDKESGEKVKPHHQEEHFSDLQPKKHSV